ncbi:MAG: hypothetical protein MRJ67_01910 [Nitrospirales bacterium]|nr:hypothetical protein [Nitrospirales bacterium]
MDQILQQPTTKTWRLLSITGLALSIAFFLNAGQARTLPLPYLNQSLKAQSTPHTNMTPKTHPLEQNRASQSIKFTDHGEGGARDRDRKDPILKKKFGLAILFLGTLAEKS